MQPTENPQANRAPEVEPDIRHTVPWQVTSVTALPDARLNVTFVDGTKGEVHMDAFLSNAKVDGTVFEPLRNPAVFAQVQVVLDAIRERGVWVLD